MTRRKINKLEQDPLIALLVVFLYTRVKTCEASQETSLLAEMKRKNTDG